MSNHNFSTVAAVILPVALGLGLVYLTIVGRIDASAAVVSALAIAAVVGVLVFLRDFSTSQELDDRQSRE